MKSKPKTNICVIYYNKFDDSFVRSIPIENCAFSIQASLTPPFFYQWSIKGETIVLGFDINSAFLINFFESSKFGRVARFSI